MKLYLSFDKLNAIPLKKFSNKILFSFATSGTDVTSRTNENNKQKYKQIITSWVKKKMIAV